MKYLSFIFLITLAFFACKNEASEEKDITAAESINTNAPEQSDDEVPLYDKINFKIYKRKWSVTSWDSEEMRSTLGENYDSYKEEQEARIYEFTENGRLVVWKDDKTVSDGGYSVAISGKEIKLQLDGKTVMATLNFPSENRLSLTWVDGNASITVSLKTEG